ncbi:Putative Zinc finger, PHD-type, ubiquitin interacting, Zinc finger, FYVE/PHD-type [Septoria linicola]|uniref:Zinc finger, PHD-type, ubiquitin interacting, Zinc finger, FYVE/PHD-type n=1 Tax=Septoria linicola TaxID=215465 RepID=A0A9Q9ARV7_9PEZI|nr:putative Zinc finger, PHD-type, ubiquitin interacting, Zinc finger, FYVE/PHD-type [Septoria linicola]USW52043.1 Putative Zinc finger, PHD-type, ubiquitin interacting, Zinc finger, FYVE/PHD-type [Septoria linicola]
MPPSPPARRSTRGAPPAAPASTTSSSLSSTRQDRNARNTAAQKSATPRSLSSEDISEPPRRSQRSQAAQKDEDASKADEAIEDGDEDAIDEEEITRCICGLQEYPGPPLSEAFAGLPDAQAEDAGELFILCDGCTVWQHGGCVGIVAENLTPELYYCEQCRPKQHAIGTDSRGQKYSLYLPLHPKASQRKGSVSKSDDRARKEREMAASRASVDPATGKRRATMRSKEHDDEEEQLRIAIEESKRESAGKGTGRRNGKRNRDDSSEESKSDIKRQRRSSESAPLAARTAAAEEDSDDQAGTSKGKAKGELSVSARQAQLEKKEQEKEKARAEAAGRRQERARSRRGDDPEQAEDTTPKPTPSRKTSPPPRSSQPPSPPPAEKVAGKKGPGKKPGKKLGNNQYTKAKLEQAASSPHGRKKQTNPVSGSGDETSENLANGESNGNKQSPTAPENTTSTAVGTGKAKFGRGKKAAANSNVVKDNEPVERTFTNMTAALSNMSAYTKGQVAEMEQARATGVHRSEMTVGKMVRLHSKWVSNYYKTSLHGSERGGITLGLALLLLDIGIGNIP